MKKRSITDILISIIKVLFRFVLAFVGIFCWKTIFETFSSEIPRFLKNMPDYVPAMMRNYVPSITFETLKRGLIILTGIFLFFFLIAQIEELIGHPLFQKKTGPEEEAGSEENGSEEEDKPEEAEEDNDEDQPEEEDQSEEEDEPEEKERFEEDTQPEEGS